jgi:hypothetical protein
VVSVFLESLQYYLATNELLNEKVEKKLCNVCIPVSIRLDRPYGSVDEMLLCKLDPSVICDQCNRLHSVVIMVQVSLVE